MTRRTLVAAALTHVYAQGAESWSLPRRGTNWFNRTPELAWLKAAREQRLRLVRLAPDKWRSAERDFLIGSADGYRGLVSEDLKLLIRQLDAAAGLGIDIVLTMLSLPGSRWRQQNQGRDDLRLWQDFAYWRQAERFWADLAKALRGHPALVGLDPLNEPHPERTVGSEEFWTFDFARFRDRLRGTPADWNAFHRAMLGAIRSEDARIPVVLESGMYATPWAFRAMEPVPDPRVLYSLHFYEPYEFTTRRLNAGRRYPGEFATVGGKQRWDRKALAALLDPVRQWQQQHGISSRQIYVGEFGCSRRVAGAAQYLEDCVELFEEYGWHWCFYAFREDEWDDLDYELGTGGLGEQYWKDVAAGRKPVLKRSRDPLFGILQSRMPE